VRVLPHKGHRTGKGLAQPQGGCVEHGRCVQRKEGGECGCRDAGESGAACVWVCEYVVLVWDVSMAEACSEKKEENAAAETQVRVVRHVCGCVGMWCWFGM
jgi:hypothetical protein